MVLLILQKKLKDQLGVEREPWISASRSGQQDVPAAERGA